MTEIQEGHSEEEKLEETREAGREGIFTENGV